MKFMIFLRNTQLSNLDLQLVAPRLMTQLTEKTTNQGSIYKVVKVPSSVSYQYFTAEDCGKVDGENNYWTIYLPMSEVRNKCFPLNANPRKPNTIGSNESTDIVVRMRNTLSQNPNKFVRLNNGLTCVCSSLSIDKETNTVTINWGEGEGILNGGHTYLSIITNPTETNARVRVEIIEISERLNQSENELEKQDFIKETAIARNSNRQLKDFTRSEFEGKHQFIQDHLDDLKGVIYWSEGYEELVTEPFHFKEKSAMKANVFIRYLALLDRNWYWHPLDNEMPTDYEIHSNLLVSGNGTYDQWSMIALEKHSAKNLEVIAPLGRKLLKLVDAIVLSMRHETNDSGTTTNPIGCGNSFTATPFFQKWAGAGQTKGHSYYDKGVEKVPKCSPHFIAYMINFTRPFVWYGDTDDESTVLVGWYHDLIEIYDMFHKKILPFLNEQFVHHQMKGRDLAANNIVASAVWRNHVKQIWREKCSLDSSNDNFWPQTFFDSKSEKWYNNDEEGDWLLCYNETDEEWELLYNDSGDELSNSRPYKMLEEAPY